MYLRFVLLRIMQRCVVVRLIDWFDEDEFKFSERVGTESPLSKLASKRATSLYISYSIFNIDSHNHLNNSVQILEYGIPMKHQ